LGWIAYAVPAYGLVTWILPVPLTVLHELGHALPLLAFSRGRVIVRVGGEPARPAGRVSDGYRILRLLRSA
jgi:hypothetical protein